jgi:glycosyltransferase involved in cell wall biosynthesis
LARWAPDTDVVPLPEPLTKYPGEKAASPLLSRVEDGRRRLVIFGSLDERKGIAVVLEALDGLPEASRKSIALLLAGRFDDTVRREVASRIGSHGAGEVQVIADDQRLPEESIQPLLRACDLVMITYQRHVGSSGQLLRAAEAGTPVLASDYGLVGQLVRGHRLGLTVDSTSPLEIRRAIAAWLERPEAIPFDSQQAALFAGQNTDDAFAETILSRILVPNAAIR